MGRDRATRGQDQNLSVQSGGTGRQSGVQAWGTAFRREREVRGWTQVGLAQQMGYDHSVISKLETGAIAPNEQHARAADRAFGAPGTFEHWLDYVINTSRVPYERDVAEIEQRASVLDWWEPTLIPGLLQNEPYMYQVYASAQPDATDGQIQEMVAARQARQEILERTDPPPPMLHAVIWEPALHVPVGGADVMARQLEELAKAARTNRRVRVQVLPLAHGANPGMHGPFVIASFADERPAAFLDNHLSGQVTERKSDVAHLGLVFSTLTANALDERASADLIEKVASEWRT
jgi:transcriptional regulator with XRE-family HTH domain